MDWPFSDIWKPFVSGNDPLCAPWPITKSPSGCAGFLTKGVTQDTVMRLFGQLVTPSEYRLHNCLTQRAAVCLGVQPQLTT
jgi:hypothetical protein